MYKSKIPEIENKDALKLLHPSIFELDPEISIERDDKTLQIHALAPNGKEIVFFKIRDRYHDGSPRYKTRLVEWPYDSSHDKVKCGAVELSRYSRDPKQYFPDSELVQFLKEPFDYIFDEPDKFVRLWKEAFISGHFPGQSALPLKGAAKYFLERSKALANSLGFEVTLSPSHYYVAASDLEHGFCFQSSLQEKEFNEIERILSEYDLDEKILRQQKSWIVLLQKFPYLGESELSQFWLQGLEYPLYYDGENVENVWMCQSESKPKFDDYKPRECERRLKNHGII